MNLQRFRDLVARLAKERTDHERPALEVGTEMHKSMELAKERCPECGSEYTEDINDTKRCFRPKQREARAGDHVNAVPSKYSAMMREQFLAFCEKHGVDAEELAKLNLSGNEHIHIDQQTQELAKFSPEDRQLVRKFSWGFGRPTGLLPKGRTLWNLAMKAIRHQEEFTTPFLNMVHDSIYVHVQTPATTRDNRRITSTVPCDGHKGERHDAVKVSFCKAQDAWLCAECRVKVGLDPKEQGT